MPGLTLSPVSDDLADYFGDGSERGLLVLQADASWSPIRNGDVILSVDGAPVTADRLRAALDSRQSARIELLRRRRQMTVSLWASANKLAKTSTAGRNWNGECEDGAPTRLAPRVARPVLHFESLRRFWQ